VRNIVIFYILLFLFVGDGRAFADEQNLTQPASCEDTFDMSVVDLSTSFVETYLFELEDYFTCKAAMYDDIQICDIFPDGSTQRASCREGYNKYYMLWGNLFRNGRISAELLESCLKVFSSAGACEQFGAVLLSGNPDDCEKIEGITPETIVSCKDMVAPNSSENKVIFMMALRGGDPASCDPLLASPAATICKGLLNKDLDGCQLNPGFLRFKKLYCQQSTTKESTHGTEKEE